MLRWKASSRPGPRWSGALPSSPSSERHFLFSEDSINIRSLEVKVQKFHCPRRGQKLVSGLIVFGLVSVCNYSTTSLKNHKALVWFGQTYDMKLEHDDWEAFSLQSSTNKIIFSQICFCLFFSFPAKVINQHLRLQVVRKGKAEQSLWVIVKVLEGDWIVVLKRVKCAVLSWSNPVVQVCFSIHNRERKKGGERERVMTVDRLK